MRFLRLLFLTQAVATRWQQISTEDTWTDHYTENLKTGDAFQQLLQEACIDKQQTLAPESRLSHQLGMLLEEDPSLINSPDYPFRKIIAFSQPYLLQELLARPGIDIYIKENQAGYVNLLVKAWEHLPDEIKLPALENLLKAEAAVYDRQMSLADNEPLEAAIISHQMEVIRMLRKHGAAINYIEHYHRSPLLTALSTPTVDIEEKFKLVKTVLEEGADINELSPWSKDNHFKRGSHGDQVTALYFIVANLGQDAVNNDTYRLVDFLLSHNADLDKGTSESNLPLHAAIQRVDYDMVNLLILEGANPFLNNNLQENAFLLAHLLDETLPESKPRMAAFLENQRGRYVLTSLVSPLFSNKFLTGVFLSILAFRIKQIHFLYPAIIGLILCALEIKYEFVPLKGETAALYKVLISSAITVGILPITPRGIKSMIRVALAYLWPVRHVPTVTLSHQIKIKNVVPKTDSLPLISIGIACRENNLTKMTQCIDAKADLDKIEDDFTPLQRVCQNGQLTLVQLLLNAKSVLTVNRENKQGDTALLLAAKAKHWSIVHLLLDEAKNLQLNIASSNRNGETALSLAIQNLEYTTINKIIALQQPDNPGEILLQILQQRISADQIKPLNKFVESFIKANPTAIDHQDDKQHQTPLIIASREGYLGVVETLLKAGAKMYLLDDQDKFALYYAAAQAIKFKADGKKYKNFIHIIEKLVQQGAQMVKSQSKEVENLVQSVRVLYTPLPEPVRQSAPSKPPRLKKKKLEQKSVARRSSLPNTTRSSTQSQSKKPSDLKKPRSLSLPIQPIKSKDHLSWGIWIADLLVRLGTMHYQIYQEEKIVSPEQIAFFEYMQHGLLVYYVHRLLFSLTCYSRYTQSDWKLISSGDIHNMMTKHGSQSLCLYPSYEAYDAIWAISDMIATRLAPMILSGLKKPYEQRSALTQQQKLEIASLFGLIDSASLTSFRPVGQLFVRDTFLYSVLETFHQNLIDNTHIKTEHAKNVTTFLLPAISYVYQLLREDKRMMMDTQEVILKGEISCEKLNKDYPHYVDFLTLLLSLCGETLLSRKNQVSPAIVNFVYQCRKAVRNKMAHDAKIIFRAEYLMPLAKAGHQLATRSLNWQEVMSMPDLAWVRKEIEDGFTALGEETHYGRFFAPGAPGLVSPARAKTCFRPPLIELIVAYLRP